MASREYALMLNDNIIVSCVTSPCSLEELKDEFRGYTVKLLDEVPDSVKANYRWWNERP